ncbi:MAG: Isoquinoline 1-oxidoreductase subunit alpha [Fimbriimonadaceae bacterium]|nr:Isoquinoline 1-oxidoreductase subunit alpha [Fimbriimonadaceae bacterium]
MPLFKIQVNGKEHSLEAEGDMPLLWALRDLLNLNGTKYGCGVGSCGACTVLIDGKAATSCQMTLAEVGRSKIVTIEGLSRNGDHPLQKAFIEHDVPQCGYCQTGQIMAAAALLRSNPKATDEQIREAMNGNICRCGTYYRVLQAVKAVAKESR